MPVPKVSIGLPVYNGENYLRLAIDSILTQDYTDFELIISDNASADATQEICREYTARDCRIRYYRNEINIGASGNYKRVFELARGGLFKWAAHDDVHLPAFLSRCIEVFDKAPSTVVLVYPRAEVIDSDGRRMSELSESLHTARSRPHQRVADVLRNVAWATAQFGLFRSGALRKTRLIDGFFASDWVLLLELAILGEIWEIPEILFQRRSHPGISTNTNKTRAEFLHWCDPSQKAKVRLFPQMKLELEPRFRLAVEYANSVRRMPLPSNERLRCFFTALAIWFSRESHRLVEEYGRRLRRKLRKAFGVF